MAAPFPYDGISGALNDPAESAAFNLHGHYKWVARLVDEMNDEAQLDLKRADQIIDHATAFCRWYDYMQAHIQARQGKKVSELAAAFPSLERAVCQKIFDYAIGKQDADAAVTITNIVQGVFAHKKCAWTSHSVMNNDLQAIYVAAKNLADWIEANVPERSLGYSINRSIARGVKTDDPIKIAKPTGVATKLAEFRALFGPKP